MKPFIGKFIRIFFAAMALAVIVVLLGIVPFNAGFLRGQIEDAARAATGLELSIAGPIILRIGRTPGITTGGIVLGDPTDSPLLTIDSLHGKIGLIAFLRGRIHVHEFNADNIRIDYCSTLPELPDSSKEDATPPSVAVDAAEFREITVRCGTPAVVDPLQLDIGRIVATAPQGEQIQVDVEGRVSDNDFNLAATGGELGELLAGPRQYPVLVTLSSASVAADISGQLSAPLAIDAHLEIDLTGELGETRFALDVTLDSTGERPHIGLNASFEQLDVTPFMADDRGSSQPEPAAVSGDIDLSAAIDSLDTFDADVLLTARHVIGAPLQLGAVEVEGSLSNGLVELQSMTADVLGGRVSASGSFDSRAECPAMQLSLRSGRLGLYDLNNALTLGEQLGGGINAVKLESSSCGDSLFAHHSSLIADVELGGASVVLGGKPLPLVADKLTLAIAPGQNSLAHIIGKFSGKRIQATLSFGSLQALSGTSAWPLALDARGAGSRLRLKGRAAIAPGKSVVDALLEFDAPLVGTLHPWTTGAPDARLPLSATAQLHLDESRLVADKISLSLGGSNVSGVLEWDHAQDLDLMDLELRSSYLDLTEIGAAFAKSDSSSSDLSGDRQGTSTLITLPPVNLDLEFDSVRADRLDLQEFKVSGRLRQGLVEEARVSVIVENTVRLRGGLDVDLRDLPAEVSLDVSGENLDIGLVLGRLELVDDLRLHADGIELLVKTEGQTPRQLILNTVMAAELSGFNWYMAADNSADGQEPGKAFDLSLEQLSVTITPDQPIIWASSGDLDDVGVELWMQTPSLIDIVNTTAELPLTLVLAAGDDVAMIEGRIDRSAEHRLLAQVSISGEVIDSDNRALADLPSPLEDYEFNSTIVLTKRSLELPDLQMRLGGSMATGRFMLAGSGERRQLDVNLHAPFLQTDDLLYWSTEFHDALPKNENPGSDPADIGENAPKSRSVLLLVNDFIAAFRENNNLDVNVSVDELRAGTVHLGGAEIRLFIDEDEFRLKPLTFSSPGGDVDAEYITKITDGRLDATLKVRAEALSYGGLLRLADHESQARGMLYLETDFSADIESQPGAGPFDLLLKNANGSIDIAAWPENIEVGVLDLWTANLVMALLPLPESGKTSKLNCVVARFDVNDGVMKNRTVLLDSTDTIIRGRGTISLAEEQLDLLVWPQAKREKFLSASTPVKVTGSFDDFQIGVEPAGFIGTLLKWYMSLIYVPFKWLTGERFPPDGTPTCFDAMDWELTPELHDYFLRRDFSQAPAAE